MIESQTKYYVVFAIIILSMAGTAICLSLEVYYNGIGDGFPVWFWSAIVSLACNTVVVCILISEIRSSNDRGGK